MGVRELLKNPNRMLRSTVTLQWTGVTFGGRGIASFISAWRGLVDPCPLPPLSLKVFIITCYVSKMFSKQDENYITLGYFQTVPR